MHVSSLLIVLGVLTAFAGDLLPKAGLIQEMRLNLGQVPGAVRGELYAGRNSLYRDSGVIEWQARHSPELAKSLLTEMGSQAAIAMDETHQIASRLADGSSGVRERR